MGWRTRRMRIVEIAVGLAGLTVMLSADVTVSNPRSTGEWMALLAGLLWSIAPTGIRSPCTIGPAEAALVFVVGAMVTSCILAALLARLPAGVTLGSPGPAACSRLYKGGVWWALSIGSLMWVTVRLEPARVGILRMSEVLVGGDIGCGAR